MRRIEEKAERGQQQAPSGLVRVSSAGDPLNNYKNDRGLVERRMSGPGWEAEPAVWL